MGDPKKRKKQYSTPSHPWQAARIEEEKELVKEYGLKNKREVWKMRSKVKGFHDQIKATAIAKNAQAKLEKEHLMKKLMALGLVKENATMDDILGLNVRNILERRLQTVVARRGLAKSVSQARQFIVHGHVKIGEKKMTKPSHLVTKSEEDRIGFLATSTIAAADHPERVSAK